jgi:hypothetical protein
MVAGVSHARRRRPYMVAGASHVLKKLGMDSPKNWAWSPQKIGHKFWEQIADIFNINSGNIEHKNWAQILGTNS